jgi:hypothetical protein
MKCLVFDTGPIISLTMNNLLWLLEPLKGMFKGEFYITKSVKEELIDRPFQSKKFKFEAMQVLQYVSKGVIKEIAYEEIEAKARQLFNLANRCFKAEGQSISIVHFGEMEALAAAILLHALAIVVDERTTRYLVDKPEKLRRRMENKLHTQVEMDRVAIKELKAEIGSLRAIRSIELVSIAFEKGLLDIYMTHDEEKLVPEPKKNLLEGVLWSLKLNGCSVADEEIGDIVKYEMKLA